MQQTPAHDAHNASLLEFVPSSAKFVVEVGCSSGAFAREFKRKATGCRYVGIEIDSGYAELARRYCDEVLVGDIEQMEENRWQLLAGADCWVFGDTLEHLRDPWSVLSRIRNVIPANGSLVCCVPNVQHWSIQARICAGDFRYEPSGLMDRTHLRWFTRATLIQLFMSTGYQVTGGMPRIFDEPQRELVLPHIRALAKAIGADEEQAVLDALPLQYVLKAVPAAMPPMANHPTS